MGSGPLGGSSASLADDVARAVGTFLGDLVGILLALTTPLREVSANPNGTEEVDFEVDCGDEPSLTDGTGTGARRVL